MTPAEISVAGRLLKRLALLAAALLVGLGPLVPVLQAGRVDAFYARFASPRAGSLIVGTSRAAQGIRPAVLAARLGGHFEGPLLNYAFTLMHSPYGPAYTSSILRKLRPDTRQGLFIVAVDPWSVSVAGAADTAALPESRSFIGQLTEVSQRPNWQYLSRFQTKPLYRLLLDYATATERLHPDGWLEVRIGTDSAQVRARTLGKVQEYRRLAASSHLSARRLGALQQLIGQLQAHGQVVLVRLPVGPPLLQVEQAYAPDFDGLARQLAATCAVPYLDYSARPFATTDGNHLQAAASQAFTEQLAADINQLVYKQ